MFCQSFICIPGTYLSSIFGAKQPSKRRPKLRVIWAPAPGLCRSRFQTFFFSCLLPDPEGQKINDSYFEYVKKYIVLKQWHQPSTNQTFQKHPPPSTFLPMVVQYGAYRAYPGSWKRHGRKTGNHVLFCSANGQRLHQQPPVFRCCLGSSNSSLLWGYLIQQRFFVLRG